MQRQPLAVNCNGCKRTQRTRVHHISPAESTSKKFEMCVYRTWWPASAQSRVEGLMHATAQFRQASPTCPESAQRKSYVTARKLDKYLDQSVRERDGDGPHADMPAWSGLGNCRMHAKPGARMMRSAARRPVILSTENVHEAPHPLTACSTAVPAGGVRGSSREQWTSARWSKA